MSQYFPTLQRGHPPSPPDTEVAVESSMLPDPKQRAESDIASYSRRAPSIFYKQNENAPARESTRRPHQRWLIIVVPPPILHPDDSRRSSAVMLPLFPTMYGQLSAIAREFNLPSTTGVRVYMHLPESSIGGAGLVTPRITDDAWPLLWTQYFSPEDKTALPPAIPISGKIEFDFDLQQARWYNAWVRSNGQMPIVQAPTSFPGRGVREDEDSVAEGFHDPGQRFRSTHMRQLSLLERRTSTRSAPFPLPKLAQPNAEREELDGPTDERATVVTGVPTNARNTRDEVESLVQKWRANTPTVDPSAVHMSPEPFPRSLDLDDYSWSISSAGPLTYDPLASPTASDFSRVRSIHLADRVAGSVVLTPSTATSWGPPRSGFSHENSLISNASRFPSPDIAARAIPEVPLTPSTATNWSPPDDDFDYECLLMVNDDPHYLTPDIASRMMDNVPVTPSSCGPPDDRFDSSILFAKLGTGEYTTDIGERLLSPSPAFTSFPDQKLIFSHVWPYTERVQCSRQRLIFSHVWPYTETPLASLPVPLLTTYPKLNICPAAYPNLEIYPPQCTPLDPHAATSLNTKLARRYPDIEVYPAVYPFSLDCLYPSACVDAPAPDDENKASVVHVSSQVYPFFKTEASEPRFACPLDFDDVNVPSQVYPFAWDYSYQIRASQAPMLNTPPRTPPVARLYDSATPAPRPCWDDFCHTNHVPSESSAVTSVDLSSVLYPFSWDCRHKSLEVNTSESISEVDMSSQVYPFGWDYIHQPRKVRAAILNPLSSARALPSRVGGIDIQSLVYPFGDQPLKAVRQAKMMSSLTPSVDASFEDVDAASLVYPYGWDYIYHDVKEAARSISVGPSGPAVDPSSQVYPFRWDYIHKSERGQRHAGLVDLVSHIYPFSWDYTHRSSNQSLIEGSPPPLPISVDGKDTTSLIYPFSWNYVHRPKESMQPVCPALDRAYLLPAYDGVDVASFAYPFSWNYDYRPVKRREAPLRTSITAKPPSGYPDIVVYVPVYPYNLDILYPTINADEGSPTPHTTPNLEPEYPNLVVYKPVYPHNLEQVYPSISGLPGQTRFVHLPGRSYAEPTKTLCPEHVRSETVPHVQTATAEEKLPGNRHIRSRTALVNKSLDVEYPNIEIYRPVYPHDLRCIYPPASSRAQPSNEWQDASHTVVKLPSRYPSLQINYPLLEIYPDSHNHMGMIKEAPPSQQSISQTNPSLLSLPLHAARPAKFPQSMQEDEDVNGEASVYQEEPLNSSISFRSDDLDLEIDRAVQRSRRSSVVALDDVIDDNEQRLDAMDSPARRFYLARQQDLRNSHELDDDEPDPFEFDEVPLPPITFPGRPSLSLDVPPETSTFFEDDDEDESFWSDEALYQAYEESRPGRFPRPNLSAVTEETTPLSGISSPE